MTLLLLFLLYAIILSTALARAGLCSRALPASGATRNRPTRILLVGATGGTGRQLVAQALARGHVVTALVRNPARLQISHPQLKVLSGNVLDYASVEACVIMIFHANPFSVCCHNAIPR